MKRTLGNWKFEKSISGASIVVRSETGKDSNRVICSLSLIPGPYSHAEEAEGNARLISAAPTMLTVLQLLKHATATGLPIGPGLQQDILDAIKKAGA
jgi:hypothetical protein